jgi:hypothetical protein
MSRVLGSQFSARRILAAWEIVIDGKPRSYRDDVEIAREAGRFLKSKNPKSDVTVRNYSTGEVLSITVHDPLAWANGKKRGIGGK